MIIRNLFPDQPDKVHIFEAVGGAGVRIIEWQQLKKSIGSSKKKHYSRVVYRKVDFDRAENFNDLVTFFQETLGKDYGLFKMKKIMRTKSVTS